MRKSSILIILLLGALFVLTPTKSTPDGSRFDEWRPNGVYSGCHSVGSTYTQVSGSIIFNSSWLVVESGQEFSLLTTAVNFGGNLVDSNNDITIGFNKLDESNSEFLPNTIYDAQHALDENGTSDISWEPVFTAPMVTGNYTLIAYGVASATSPAYFDWVVGQVRIEVVESTGPQGVGFSIDHGGIIDDKITLTVSISNFTDVKTIELSVDNGLYQTIILQNSQFYVLDVSNLSSGNHNITVIITNQANLTTMEFIEFDIPELVITTPTENTITSEPFTQSTETTTEDHGLLSSPISLGILIVVMLISISAPLVLMRKYFT